MGNKQRERAEAARRAEADVFSTRAGKSYLEHLRAMTLSERSRSIIDELERESTTDKDGK